jgi:hypothetical protein
VRSVPVWTPPIFDFAGENDRCLNFGICFSGTVLATPAEPKQGRRTPSGKRKLKRKEKPADLTPKSDLFFLGRFQISIGNGKPISDRPNFAPTLGQLRAASRGAASKGKTRAASIRERRTRALETLRGLSPEQRHEIRRKFRLARRSRPTLLYQDWLVKHLTQIGVLD